MLSVSRQNSRISAFSGLALAVSILIAWLPVFGACLASLSLVRGLESGPNPFGAYWDLVQRNQMLEFWLVVKRSVLVSGIAVALALGVVATFGSSKPRSRTVAVALVLIPLVVPDSIRAFSWAQLLAPDGLIGKVTPGIGSTTTCLLTLMAISVVPLTFGAFFSALPSPRSTCWLAAAEMPQHRWIHFWRLTLQAVVPVLLFSLVAGFLYAMNASAEEQYLGRSSTSMQKIASGLMNIEPSLLGAFGMCLFAGIGVLSMICIWFSRASWQFSAWRRATMPAHLRQATRRFAAISGSVVPLGGAMLLTAVLLGLWLPFLSLIRLALGDESALTFPTLHFFWSAARSPQLWEAFINSLAVAASSAMASTAIAVYAGRVASAKFGGVVICLVLWPAILPADVHALSIQQLLRLVGVEQSGLAFVAVCHTSWLLPFVLTAAVFAYRKLPPTVLHAANEFGHSETTIFRRIVFPMVRVPIFTAALAAGLLSFTEFRRGWHLAGSDPLLSTRVFGALQSGAVGDGPTVYAMALVATSIGLVGCLLVGRMAKEAI
ncbi:MAG: hypothetical protein HY820_45760 [Acidobacteria bacterium]|nr:hypothetical protein [Acidobacteriota bacterium]